MIDWTEPEDNGSPILGYEIYIRQSDGVTFSQELTHCDGSDSALILATECTIPISVLMSTPFNLQYGSNIHAKVLGYNQYGDSAMSQVGSQAVILTQPDAPINVIEVTAARTESSITISWSQGASNGGATIIDYRVSFDQALATWMVRASEITV